MEKLIFTRACLSDIRVIVAIYVCTLSRVAMLGSDRMNPYTRVPATRHAWGL
jgi:hypothetical protein